MNEKLQPGHEQYAEDLALYAVGALEAGSCAQLELHLQECPACRRELETLRGDAAVLALSVSGVDLSRWLFWHTFNQSIQSRTPINPILEGKNILIVWAISIDKRSCLTYFAGS